MFSLWKACFRTGLNKKNTCWLKHHARNLVSSVHKQMMTDDNREKLLLVKDVVKTLPPGTKRFHLSATSKVNHSWRKQYDESELTNKMFSRVQFNVESLQALLQRQRQHKKMAVTILIALTAGVGFYLYHYHDEVADTLADTVSHVATKSLEDDSLLTSAQAHTMQLLHNILNNDQMKEEAVKFVMHVLQTDEVQEKARDLLIKVVNDPAFLKAVQERLNEITYKTLMLDETKAATQHQLHAIFNSQATQAVMEDLMQNVLQRDGVQVSAGEFMQQVIGSEDFSNKSTELGQNIAAKVLEDEEVRKKAGEALWSALKFSVVPARLWSNPDPQNNNNKQLDERKFPSKPSVVDELIMEPAPL